MQTRPTCPGHGHRNIHNSTREITCPRSLCQQQQQPPNTPNHSSDAIKESSSTRTCTWPSSSRWCPGFPFCRAGTPGSTSNTRTCTSGPASSWPTAPGSGSDRCAGAVATPMSPTWSLGWLPAASGCTASACPSPACAASGTCSPPATAKPGPAPPAPSGSGCPAVGTIAGPTRPVCGTPPAAATASATPCTTANRCSTRSGWPPPAPGTTWRRCSSCPPPRGPCRRGRPAPAHLGPGPRTPASSRCSTPGAARQPAPPPGRAGVTNHRVTGHRTALPARSMPLPAIGGGWPATTRPSRDGEHR